MATTRTEQATDKKDEHSSGSNVSHNRNKPKKSAKSMWSGLNDDFGATPPSSPELGPVSHKEVRKAAFVATVVVESAACLLTLLAGWVNAATIILFNAPVAHVTGLATRTAMVAEEGGDFFTQPNGGGGQILCFVGGSTLCGLIIGRHRAKFGLGMYGLSLILVSGFLVLAFITEDVHTARNMCATAMGLQNGIGSTFSGGLLRTTHITGTATDLGLQVGRIVGRRVKAAIFKGGHSQTTPKTNTLTDEQKEFEINELKRAWLLFVLLFGFFIGGVLGSWFSNQFQKNALIVPISVNIILGVAYVIYRVRVLRQHVLGEEYEETTRTRGESAEQTHMHSPARQSMKKERETRQGHTAFELVVKEDIEELKI